MEDRSSRLRRREDRAVPARRTEIGYVRPAGPEPDPEPAASWLPGLLRRRYRAILAGFAAVFTLVAIATFLLPATYESTASFLVEQRQQTGGAGEALAVLDQLGRVRNTETEVALIQGRRVVEPVVDRLDLHVRFDSPFDDERPADAFPAFDAGPSAEPGSYHIVREGAEYLVVADRGGETLARGPPGDTLRFAGITLTTPDDGAWERRTLIVTPFGEAVETVRRRRVVAEPAQRQADLIQLTCEGRTPQEASALCLEMQRSYLELRSQLQRAEATAAADFLDGQVKRVRANLTLAEDSLRMYQERNQAVALQERATQAVIGQAAMQAKLRELKAEHTALQSLIESLESDGVEAADYSRLASFPTFLRSNDNVVSRLVESLVQLENRRSDLAVRRTGADPDLAAIETRITELEAQLLANAQSYGRSLDAEIRALEATAASQVRDLTAVPELQIETARLERRVAVLEDLYRFLQTRLQEAQVAEAVTLPSVRVVDQPSLPHRPAFPDVPLNLALGAVLGLGAGVLSALWRERTDRTVRDWRGVDRWGIPVLAMVPRVARSLPAARGAELPRGTALTLGRRSPAELAEIASEAFRTLLFELEAAHDGADEPAGRAIAVASPGRGDGKTFCAAGLAIEAATMGTRTLLIDADLRAQGAARYLNVPRDTRGLAEVVHDGQDPLDHVRPVAVGPEVTLDFLPPGTPTGPAPGLLKSGLSDVVRSLAQRYELIVVDTPPINVLSDAAQVATVVDGVVLVVRAGGTEQPALQMALERLSRIRARVLGFVLNEVELPAYYTSYSGAVRDAD